MPSTIDQGVTTLRKLTVYCCKRIDNSDNLFNIFGSMSRQDVGGSRREVGGGHSHHVLLSLLPILLCTFFDTSRDFTLEKVYCNSTHILEKNVRIRLIRSFSVCHIVIEFNHSFSALLCILLVLSLVDQTK